MESTTVSTAVSTLRSRCEAQLAHFVGGPADGLLRMIAVDEFGMPTPHVYVPDDQGVTHHMYGAVLGADAEYQYLGPLPIVFLPSSG